MSFKHLRNVRGFLSDYYLGAVFGRGHGRGRKKTLSDRDTDRAYERFRRLRERAENRSDDAAACRERFLRPLLRDVLGYHLGGGAERVHGLYPSAAAEQEGARPLLLAYLGAWDEDLDAGRGRQNPMQRLGELLARERLSYGLLLTGERARLIRAQGEGPRGAYLEADLAGLAEEADPESFAAFAKLFAAANFLPDDEGRRPMERIEAESREHAQRVTDDLKEAVFRAAESTISALIADAVDRGEIASPLELGEAELRAYRDAGLLCLYRLLFILYAEARDPRLDQHQIYRRSYSAQGLVEEVLKYPERRWPENRCYLWGRIRALFRIYDKGLPAITPWDHIPARGGDFFSAATDAGQILDRARLSDRQVARMVLDLATAAPRRGVGRERVSFRELDIESLGAVYEGLLEYEPRVARETTIELRVQGRTYALSPDEVVRLCRERELKLHGDAELVAGTAAESFHPDAPGEDEGEEGCPSDEETEAGEEVAAADGEGGGEEEEEHRGVKKGATARLLRRLEPGDFHFVPGPGRKGSGSYYTPRALVRDLVHHALGPLVAGKRAAEIERLRVLDPACGSAHFLVEAMRFLGQALHRAYVEEYGGEPPPGFVSTTGQGWDADWQASDEEARAANSEARAWCKRRIAERCLFGVDVNPTAVQLARVALWIESVAGDRPLTFFEHHIRCGNSLLGTWMERLEEPPRPLSRRQASPRQILFPFQEPVRQAIREAARLRRLIDEARPEDLLREGIEPESLEEMEFKRAQLRRAEETLAAARLLFDLRSASAFVPEIWREWDELTQRIAGPAALHRYARSRPWWREFEEVRNRERFFHWELEFPEVFLDGENPGFDAVLGNPPWDKIKPDRKEFYGRHDVLIRAFVGGELDQRIRELQARHPRLSAEFQAYEERVKTLAACLRKGGDYRYQDWEIDGKTTGGDPDAFKFFVERAWQLARHGGRVGMLVPSAIYNNEGCTGLRHLLLAQAQVERFYAFENRKKLFPIDSRYKFVSLVFRKGEPKADGFPAAFMRQDLAELEASARHRDPAAKAAEVPQTPWVVTVRRSELERLSPGTLAFLEYRSPRDREILLKMYGYDAEGNPVNPRPLLGDQGPGTWNARFYTEFHMTNDRYLWTDPTTGRLWNPRQVLGPIAGTTSAPPYYDPAAWPEIRQRMAEKGFWPLYEGKHIEQFLVDIRPIERWVSLERCEIKYGRLPDPGPKLVFRDIASNTNERTCIAAVLAERSCAGNSLSGIASDLQPDVMASVLNSFPLDFSIRLRTAGTNLNFTYVERFAVPPPDVTPSLLTLSTRSVATTAASHVGDLPELWEDVWQTNRAVAEAYGLTPDDFEYILSTFPVFARKRPAFYAYLQERVQEWKQELEGTKAYAMPAAKLARAAKTPAPSATATERVRQPAASVPFQQAAVLAWVVQKLYSPGYPVSRFRVQKMLHLIEVATETGLFTDFRKQAAGPYDSRLRYKGPEDIAVRQRRWLMTRGDSHFEPGPNIEEALRYAPRYLDEVLAELVLDEFRAFKDETLERWTTVHLAAVELRRQGQPVTPETIVAYIESVPEWQPKLSQEEFAPGRIADALEGLRRMGLLPTEGHSPQGGGA